MLQMATMQIQIGLKHTFPAADQTMWPLRMQCLLLIFSGKRSTVCHYKEKKKRIRATKSQAIRVVFLQHLAKTLSTMASTEAVVLVAAAHINKLFSVATITKGKTGD